MAAVAGFAVLLTLATGVLFGLAPAWHAAEVPLAAAMSVGSRTSTERAGRVRSALAVAEVAVAIVLLAGAGLLIRTLLSLDKVDPGNREHSVLTMVTVLPDSRYPTPAHTTGFLSGRRARVDGAARRRARVVWWKSAVRRLGHRSRLSLLSAIRRPTPPTSHRRTTRSLDPVSSRPWASRSSVGVASAPPIPLPRCRCAWSARPSSGDMRAAAIR